MGRPCFNNVENNLSGVSLMVRSMLALQTPNLHTLFSLHTEARGQIAEKTEEHEFVFAVDADGADITPFDSERIAAEFL